MATFSVQPDAATGKDTSVISGNPTNNNGVSTTLFAATTSKGLLEFDCSSIPSTATCDNATLYLYQIATGSNSTFTITVRSIAIGNAAWIEGTRNAAVALAGEPCWNARVANGAGGVTTAWAGSAGLATSGTDFETTALGTVSGNRTNANGTEYAVTLVAARVQGWFGVSNTNYGMLLNANASVGGIGSSDHATAAWRPKLVINYTVSGAPYSLVVDPGSLTLTGIAANPEYGRRFSSEAATFAMAGAAASLEVGYKLVAATNAFVLTGIDASLEVGYRLTAANGSFALTGIDADLIYAPLVGYTLGADGAAFALTGTAANVAVGRRLLAAGAEHTLTGIDATLTYTPLAGYPMTADSGTFTLDAPSAAFLHAALMAALQADYALTAYEVELLWSGYVAPPTPPERIYTVAYEDRLMTVAVEVRIFVVEPDTRIHVEPLPTRQYDVAAESRLYEIVGG